MSLISATKMVFTVFCLIFISLSFQPANGEDWQTSWTVRIDRFGSPLLLNCTPEASSASNITSVSHWILPDIKLINPNDYETWPPKMHLLDKGKSLNISRVEKEHMGPYMCYFNGSYAGYSGMHYTRMIVYLYEPTPWEMFGTNVIVGAIAAGVMLLLSISFCVINYFRWQPPVSTGHVISQQHASLINNGYDGRLDDGLTTIRSEHGVTVVSIEMPSSKQAATSYGAKLDGFTHM